MSETNTPSPCEAPLQKMLALAVSFFLLLFTVCWNLPDSDLSQGVYSLSQYIMYPLGLTQNWHMFIGDATHGFTVRVVEGYDDGSIYIVPDLNLGKAQPEPSTMREFARRIYEQRQAGYLAGTLSSLCKNPQGSSVQPAWVRIEVATFPVANIDDPSTFLNKKTVSPSPFLYEPSDFVRCNRL